MGSGGDAELTLVQIRAAIDRATESERKTRRALDLPEELRRRAVTAYAAARDEIVTEQLREIPVKRLKETTEGRVRFGPLEMYGVTTVADVLAAGTHDLLGIPGVGESTATQVVGAAQHLRGALRSSVRVRFDVGRRPRSHAELLAALHTLHEARRLMEDAADDLGIYLQRLHALVASAAPAGSRLQMLFSRRAAKDRARQAAKDLIDFAASPRPTHLMGVVEAVVRASNIESGSGMKVWEDYLARPVHFNGLLIEIGGLGPDDDAAQGFIPSEIAKRVHAFDLDTEGLKVSLRGYQAFGAKFVLVQRKAMLGDEMGLGKTIEALAVMTHLANAECERFLVVCPASVVVNWEHETARHSSLRPWRMHGADRDRNLRQWERYGGVGITTFDSLRSIDFDSAAVNLLVVDEAHYIKNPAAVRTKAVRARVGQIDRALYLTGTPMENRVEEFKGLVSHLQPEVARSVSALDGLVGAARFRQAVAPAYLRRNQDDVLQELPPRVENEEWVALESDDLAAYRQAVASGNFMAMRRAAYAPGSRSSSAKLARLCDIVEEAAASGRKVVVFSFFLDVLFAIHAALDGLAMGPLTGKVSAIDRQRLVDDFAARREPAALVCQINAGGTGLNMQAGSVVILAEPQWKPSIEEQAIARCHRMGQTRPVEVHRLLAEDTVDQRMLEVLAGKSALFDEYVRVSDLKDASPEAVDVADAVISKKVATEAESERRIIELERKRLGLIEETA